MGENGSFVKGFSKKTCQILYSGRLLPTSDLSCRECDNLPQIVGLDLHVVGRLITAQLAAFLASVDDDISLLGIGERRHRLQSAAAIAGSVPGVHVQMERPQAKRAMIAGSLLQRQHLLPAVRANKSAVIFGKSLYFHN